MALARLLSSLLLLAASAGAMPLVGYLCPSCPSAPDPAALVREIHPAYSHVVLAFAGWDATGAIQNQWDAPDKGFTVNASVVSALQARGLRVLLSLGGGAGNVLPGPPADPDAFVANMARGLLALVHGWGLDGVDFDLENFSGDAVQGMAAVARVIEALHANSSALLITGAPQMTDVYPGWPGISAGFNRYAPLLGNGFLQRHFAFVMPQMYNSWAAVETAAYAQQYAAQLLAGYSIPASAGNPAYNVTVPGTKLLLGYPASPSGASSGFLPPATVVGVVQALAANASTAIAGLMTWSIGWDQQAGWEFAKAVAAAGLAGTAV